MSETPFSRLADAAERYGRFSLENYAGVRSLAERISAGFCGYLRGNSPHRCCYLVPPDGAWAPADFRSGAFSVSGGRFLPLAPIRFGLAVRVSRTGDWMRVVLTASRHGEAMDVHLQGGETHSFELPLEEEKMTGFFEHLHRHLVNWFEEESRHYEVGAYGGGGRIGFEFHEAAAERDSAPDTDEMPPGSGG